MRYASLFQDLYGQLGVASEQGPGSCHGVSDSWIFRIDFCVESAWVVPLDITPFAHLEAHLTMMGSPG